MENQKENSTESPVVVSRAGEKKVKKLSTPKILVLLLLALAVLGASFFIKRRGKEGVTGGQGQSKVTDMPEFPIVPNAEVLSSEQYPRDGQTIYTVEMKVSMSQKEVEDWYKNELERNPDYQVQQIQEGIVNFRKGETIYTVGVQEIEGETKLLIAVLAKQ